MNGQRRPSRAAEPGSGQLTSVNAWRQSCAFGETSSHPPFSRLAPSARLWPVPSSLSRPLQRRPLVRSRSAPCHPPSWRITGNLSSTTARRRSLRRRRAAPSCPSRIKKRSGAKSSPIPAPPAAPGRVVATTQGVFGPAGPACQAVPANRDFDQLLSIRADSTLAR